MTLTTETVRVQYSGDGATAAFAVTYVFWGADDLQVILTDADGVETTWTRGTQYTVSGGDGSTGTVTVDTSPTDYTPASGTKLTILSNLDNTQETSLPAGGPFPSTSVEDQFDKVVRMIQQMAGDLSRAIKLKVSSAFSELTIPDPEALKFLRWNSGATALENADIEAAGSIGIPVAVAKGGTGGETAGEALTNLGFSAFIQTLINDADAATARDTLGVYSEAEVDSAITAGNTAFTTGDVKLTLKTTADSGWVLMNDGTIGNAASGGTTRANADTEDLFTLLWNNVTNTYAAVSSGRGASAAADFAANKTIALTKVLGRELGIAGSGSGLTARALGETLGAEDAIAVSHTHTAGTLAADSGGTAHTHSLDVVSAGGGGSTAGFVYDDSTGQTMSPATQDTNSGGGAHVHTVSGSTASAGSSGSGANMPPTSFLNAMIKL